MKKILIFLVIVAIVFGISFYFANKYSNESYINNATGGNTTVTNKPKNNETSNVINNKTNTVNNEIENSVNNTIENNIEENQGEVKETFTEDVKTEEEKAKNIVSKDWNKSSDTITVDGMNQNGEYIVTVRDSSTTEALAYYTVNVTTGNFNRKDVY